MQQFRVVELDDNDNVVRVIMESEIFPGNSKHDRDFSDAQYHEVLELDSEFDLNDYDNVPPMEFQRRECKDGVWSNWKYFSDPVEDYYNI